MNTTTRTQLCTPLMIAAASTIGLTVANADFVGLTSDSVAIDQSGWVGSDARDLYLVSVYAEFDDAADRLVAVYGSNSNATNLVVTTDDSSGFWQYDQDSAGFPSDYNISKDILPADVSLFGSAAYDSYLTIGLVGGAADNELQEVGIEANSEWDSFNDGSGSLTVTDGAIFTTPDDPQGVAGDYADNKVLVGQFAVGAGTNLNATLNLQWRNNANATQYSTAQNVEVAVEGGDQEMVEVGYDFDLDFNGDDKRDLMWLNTANNKYYAELHDGPTNLDGGYVSDGTATWELSEFGDFNGDGMTDIVWYNTGDTKHYIALMDGITEVSRASFTSGTGSWEIVDFGDFNGDLNSDVVWLNTGNNRHWIDLMDGSTVLSGGYISSGTGDWSIVDYADFDGDGKTDVLWINGGNGRHWIDLMNGSNVSSGAYCTDGTGDWTYVDIGDFSADGKADIVWLDNSNSRHAVALMDGQSEVSRGYFSSGTGSWEVVDYGDFNGDNMMDVVWLDNSTNRHYIGLMNGSTETSGNYFSSGVGLWSVISYGDFDGDGNDDVVWLDGSNNKYWIDLMSGFSVISGAYFTSGSADWELIH